jgi:uncharacterized protein YigE (DUF2233 family)
LLSGSLKGYRQDVPVGLLIADGTVKSSIDTSPPRDPAGATCRLATESKYQYSGILCIADSATGWRIIDTADYKPQMCRHALQSGPMMIEKSGQVGICPTARTGTKPISRTAVCMDATNMAHFIYSEPIEIYTLANWLRNGPLKCKVALSLSSGSQAGFAELSTSSKLPRFIGSPDQSLASAIYLESR